MAITESVFKESVEPIIPIVIEAETLLRDGTANTLIDEIKKDIDSIDSIKNENRNLRIGIVGEVKAGKSSFLNALVFKGEEVLPKAPTPMTAALTKIGFAKEQFANIYFYSKEDWTVIEERERDYQAKITIKLELMIEEWKKRESKTTIEYQNRPKPTREAAEKRADFTAVEKSCHQLMQMVRVNSINVYEFLGQTRTLNGKNLINELDSYVGSQGAFTPIVKYTEVFLDNDALKDVEIVDTPGLNDPVTSRSMKTKEFLNECDVVFLLSYVGQFFGQGDVSFLTNEVAEANIKKAVLVGTKLDSGILDYNKANASFSEAYHNSIATYNRQAKSVITNAYRENPYIDVLKSLSNEKSYFFVSSLMYQAAMQLKNNQKLGEYEEFIINSLKRYSGFQANNIGFLLGFAGIDGMKQSVLLPIIKDKTKLIYERVNDYGEQRFVKYLHSLENLIVALQGNVQLLKNVDADELSLKKEIIVASLNSSRTEVQAIFTTTANEVKRNVQNIKSIVAQERENHSNLVTDITTKRWTSKEGGFLGFFQDTVHHEETIHSVSVSQVIENTNGYIESIKATLRREFPRIYDIDKIRVKIKQAITKVFKNLDGFNENDVLLPVECVLDTLTVTEVDFDSKHYRELIAQKFPQTTVRGDSINDLRFFLTDLLFEILNDAEKKLDDKVREIALDLTKTGSTFIDDVEGRCKTKLDSIIDQLNDREKAIEKYETVIEQIKNEKKKLANFKG